MPILKHFLTEHKILGLIYNVPVSRVSLPHLRDHINRDIDIGISFLPVIGIGTSPKKQVCCGKKKEKKNVLDILIRVADAVVGTVNKPAITHSGEQLQKKKAGKATKKKHHLRY